MTAVLHIQLFGGLTISRGDTPASGFISNKVPALLAYLAVTRRAHQRDVLAALLWSEMSEADAKNNLRQALSNLRKQLAPWLLVTREIVQFNTAAPHTLDTAQFDSRLQNGRDSHETNRITAFQQAAALYQGDFLTGFFVRDAPEFEEWLLTHRVRYRELALHALHTLTEYHLNRGEYGRAIDTATRLLALEPWREEAHRQLMLALARSGQRSAALVQYETCRCLLEKDLEVEPSAETTALYERLRRADATRRHNLPPPVTPFVGREEEMKQIQRLLADPACRLLTLIGPGGIGKTRLALQTGQQSADAFLHGVWFVPLEVVGIESVLPAIADALQLSLEGTADAKTQLITYLRSRNLLLILDNVEDLLPAMELLSAIVRQAPEVKILVTSRERLNLQVEWVYEVAGLPVPNDGGADSSAVQLFVQSGQRVRPNFALTEANVEYVRKICRLVEGFPLGIELAAAWVRTFDCTQIAQEIEASLDFLVTTQADVPKRQRSLRATYDYTLQRLPAEVQSLFCRLAIFKGTFSLEAAGAVAEVNGALMGIFVDHSLVQRRPSGRYALHPLLQHFAAERLTREVGERHAVYYGRLLEQHAAGIAGGRQQKAMATAVADMDNIRAAWQWFCDQHDLTWIDKCLYLVYTLYEMRGWFEEGAVVFGRAVEALRPLAQTNPDGPPLIARLQITQGIFCVRLGWYEQARTLLEQGLEVVQQIGANEDLVRALNALGHIAYYQRDMEQAQSRYHACLDLWREIGDPVGLTVPLNNLGCVAYELGQYAEARDYFEESVALCRRYNDRWGLTFSLAGLADVLTVLADFARARLLYVEGVQLSQELEAMPRLLAILVGMAEWVVRQQPTADEYALARQTAVFTLNHLAAEPDTRERAAALEKTAAQYLPPVMQPAVDQAVDVNRLLAQLLREMG